MNSFGWLSRNEFLSDEAVIPSRIENSIIIGNLDLLEREGRGKLLLHYLVIEEFNRILVFLEHLDAVSADRGVGPRRSSERDLRVLVTIILLKQYLMRTNVIVGCKNIVRMGSLVNGLGEN